MKSKLFSLIFYYSLTLPVISAQNVLTPVDQDSRVHFVIKNFGIRTSGDFKGIKGQIQFDPKNLSTSFFDVTVDASTVDTDNNTRDGHLRKEEYFDVTKFPTIHIKSTQTQMDKNGKFILKGNLTIKGITKPIQFHFIPTAKKNGGYTFSSYDLTINRRDFTVGGNSISLSDDVKISLSVLAQ